MTGRRVLFLGLGHLSNGDISIAADFARQLPPDEFEVGFVTSAAVAGYVRGLGLKTYPLESEDPRRNLEAFDRLVAEFRPGLLVAADAFTLDYSTAWSGLSMSLLRERYDIALASFDQYDYPAADYVVDFYGGHRTRFPRLLDSCDLLIRNSPLNRPVPGDRRVAVTRMVCGGPATRPVSRHPTRVPTVFLTNSRWEYVNVVRSPVMTQLMRSMPRLIHSHLAALDRPLRVVHVGPTAWDFSPAPAIDYQYVPHLAPEDFHVQLAAADLYLTGNAVSVTLTQAVLAGVPSLLLDNRKVLDVGRLVRAGSAPGWLTEAAPGLEVAYPYRVFPWGWHDFLTPVLTDNPYTDCFLTAGVFERRKVLRAMSTLLDDAATRAQLADRQADLVHRLDQLPSAGEALSGAELPGW
ncbi:DUF6365 family protein [Streptomyces sp. WI04-05B]|uniref:DUF6365 family protein n=1 Tax=Streptomyces TaxID=1883 RepID=UPI0029BAE22C|nr:MULTISPECIES: DUF6365 family protein [unclassified Streptomyces]MDX2545374.1 DUF6365 family protein [Streptomyces sp. WI04-05B]MDX2588131.1 DUF6365 family protein [Streptomyces sp. WI04-05A]MDX3749108.1 DUF6365 family protein [Streptomyces sp. AK08-02]